MSEVGHLLQKSRRTLEEARHLWKNGYDDGSISRAYYAMFHAAEAALLTENVTVSTHSGVHQMFGKYFIKTGALPEQLSTHLGQVFEARQSADYGNIRPAQEEAEEALQKATSFVEQIETHLGEHL